MVEPIGGAPPQGSNPPAAVPAPTRFVGPVEPNAVILRRPEGYIVGVESGHRLPAVAEPRRSDGRLPVRTPLGLFLLQPGPSLPLPAPGQNLTLTILADGKAAVLAPAMAASGDAAGKSPPATGQPPTLAPMTPASPSVGPSDTRAVGPGHAVDASVLAARLSVRPNAVPPVAPALHGATPAAGTPGTGASPSAAIAGTGTGALPPLPVPAPPGADLARAFLSAAPPAARSPGREDVAHQLSAVLGALAATPGRANELAGLLPRPDSTLGPALLLMLHALRGGGVRTWIGERITNDLSRKGHDAALGRLDDTLAPVSRELASEGRWQLWALPWHYGDRLGQFYWAMRENEGSTGESSPRPTRFAMEFDLAALGPIQVQGDVLPGRLALDLLLHKEIPDPVKAAMRAGFADLMAEFGYEGTLRFRAAAGQWLDLRPPGGLDANW